MSRGGWARPVHRWTSIVFTLAVIANFVVRGLGQGAPPVPRPRRPVQPSSRWISDPGAPMKMRKKSDLPQKTCAACGLPFTWRKKWERDWDNVRYCSDRCRGKAKARGDAPGGKAAPV